MKRILITGVSGFIGSSLRSFIEKNLSSFVVYGMDTSFSKSTQRCFKVDLSDKKSFEGIIKKISPDYIFHLAGFAKKDNPLKLLSANVLSTYNLLDSLLNLKNSKARVIIPGSAAEYGRVSQKDMPVKETHSLEPINSYGYVKMYQTLLALSFCEKGLDIVVGRIFNTVGWGSPKKLAIGRFASQISLIEKGKTGTTITAGNLGSKRDFVDIKDICSALIAIANKGKSGEIYNICYGKSQRIETILNSLIKMSNCSKYKIKFFPKSFSEVKDMVGSNKKIKRDTGWVPEIKILESLRNTLSYYREKNDK